MRNEGHIDIAKATLRGVTVTRHAVARFDGGRTFVATVGLGWPRLWAFSTEAIVSGFGEGVAKSGSARGAERLRAAMQGARERFIERCEALIERQLPDALKRACEFARKVDAENTAREHVWSARTSSFLTGLAMADILADLRLDQESLMEA